MRKSTTTPPPLTPPNPTNGHKSITNVASGATEATKSADIHERSEERRQQHDTHTHTHTQKQQRHREKKRWWARTATRPQWNAQSELEKSVGAKRLHTHTHTLRRRPNDRVKSSKTDPFKKKRRLQDQLEDHQSGQPSGTPFFSFSPQKRVRGGGGGGQTTPPRPLFGQKKSKPTGIYNWKSIPSDNKVDNQRRDSFRERKANPSITNIGHETIIFFP